MDSTLALFLVNQATKANLTKYGLHTALTRITIIGDDTALLKISEGMIRTTNTRQVSGVMTWQST